MSKEKIQALDQKLSAQRQQWSDTIRALATSASGMSPTSGMKGPLAVELD